MFGQLMIKATGLVRNARYFRRNVALRDVKQVSTPTGVAPQKPKTPDPETVLGPKMHRCSNFDKWMLTWVKKYPSKNQVPDKIPLDTYLRAQGQARIKTANRMIIFTLIGCVAAVISGKREAKLGNTIGQQNIDWHNKINKEYKASQDAAAAAAAAAVKPS